MTPPTQDDLAAGRELDKRVAEALGWTFAHTEHEYDPRTPGSLTLVGVTPDKHRLAVVPVYSTDIGAAWQIVEHMDSLGWKVQVRSDSQLEGYEVDEPWVCVFASRDGAPWAAGNTAPLAICRAALKAASG